MKYLLLTLLLMVSCIPAEAGPGEWSFDIAEPLDCVDAVPALCAEYARCDATRLREECEAELMPLCLHREANEEVPINIQRECFERLHECHHTASDYCDDFIEGSQL